MNRHKGLPCAARPPVAHRNAGPDAVLRCTPRACLEERVDAQLRARARSVLRRKSHQDDSIKSKRTSPVLREPKQRKRRTLSEVLHWEKI